MPLVSVLQRELRHVDGQLAKLRGAFDERGCNSYRLQEIGIYGGAVLYLVLAHALEVLAAGKVPRHNIKFFRTDAIIFGSRPAVAKKAKNALLNLTADTLNRPSGWFTFNGKALLEGSKGEGKIFRVFDCARPVQK